MSALLGIESMIRQHSLQSNQVLNRLLGVMPKPILFIDHAGAGDLKFSHDGRWIAGGCDGYTAGVFDSATGKEVSHLAPGGLVLSLRFSPNDRWIATGGDDSTARVSEATTGKEISHLVHSGSIWSVRFSPDGLWVATASADRTARVFEAATGREVSRVTHDGPVSSVDFSPDGRWVAAAGGGSTRVFEAATGKEISRSALRGVVEVVFSPDGRQVIAVGRNSGGMVIEAVFEAATGREIAHSDNQTALFAALSPDGRRVAKAGSDKSVWISDVNSGNEISRLRHEDMVTAIGFSPDGRWVMTANVDGTTIRVFEAATGREIADIPRGYRWVAISPDGRRVVARGMYRPDHTVAGIFDVGAGKEVAPPEGPRRVYSTAFSSNTRWFATGGEDKFARVFNASTGQQIAEFKHDDPVRAVALSTDGRWIATATRNKSARIFEIATGSEVSRLALERNVHALVFSPNRRWIATEGYSPQLNPVHVGIEGAAQVLEAVTGTKISGLPAGGFSLVLHLVLTVVGSRIMNGFLRPQPEE